MNPSQTAIAELIKIGTTKHFPGNLIVQDLQENTDLWYAYYATLHNCTFPGTFSVYDPISYDISGKCLHEIFQGKMEYNKLCVYSTGKNNRLLEELARKNWGCKHHNYQSGLIHGEVNYHIQLLIFHWY